VKAVVALWRECGLVVPSNDPEADILHKIRFQPDLFLVGHGADGRLQATVMAGYEGHRGWINYLAVAPPHRRRGLGRRMLAAAEERLRQLGCPKINLQVRRTNTAVIDFYRRGRIQGGRCRQPGQAAGLIRFIVPRTNRMAPANIGGRFALQPENEGHAHHRAQGGAGHDTHLGGIEKFALERQTANKQRHGKANTAENTAGGQSRPGDPLRADAPASIGLPAS
jgi:ribosomal protein S18 acetylase RimI-like enzyme